MVTMQRKAIESLYIGRCNIYYKGEVTDPITNITSQGNVELALDEPCRLSYKDVPVMKDSDTTDTVTQTIKLFLKPELDIPAGSQFEVTQHGKTVKYRNSGFPRVHTSHQEITLKLADKFGRLNG